MAIYKCLECDYEGAGIDFKVGEHIEIYTDDDGNEEEEDVFDYECPSCGATNVYET